MIIGAFQMMHVFNVAFTSFDGKYFITFLVTACKNHSIGPLPNLLQYLILFIEGFFIFRRAVIIDILGGLDICLGLWIFQES